MRREGFEVSISRPRVVYQEGENGERLEPIEEVVIDVDDEYAGVVIEKLSMRRAELKDMRPSGSGKTRITLESPSRSLIGYQGEFLTDTRGSGVLNRVFSHYEPYKGAIEGRRNGVLVSNSDGETAAYALWNLEERGFMFVGANEKCYQGMIIGENSRPDDLDVNPMKAKQLTNVRASGKDEAIRLTPPRRPTLEQAIAYIDDDELVEVTPKKHPHTAQTGAEPLVPQEADLGKTRKRLPKFRSSRRMPGPRSKRRPFSGSVIPGLSRDPRFVPKLLLLQVRASAHHSPSCRADAQAGSAQGRGDGQWLFGFRGALRS